MALKYRSRGQIAWSGGLSTSKINFFFTITIRIEVQLVVCLCISILRNESCRRNPSFTNKAAAEMFGTRHSVTMTDFHRIYINNYELYSDWIIANHYVNSSPLN